jgi:signal transduction histidine kinase
MRVAHLAERDDYIMTNDLSAQLARLAELETEFAAALEREKVAALYQLAYGLSHEFNNPLANISSRAQALLADEKDPERRRKLAAINAQAFRAHEMIADLMLFAKPPRLDKQPTDLAELLQRAVLEMKAVADEQQTTIALEVGSFPPVAADRTSLLEAVKAVLKNSLEALGEDGRITLRLEADEEAATIAISDTGPGIPPEVRQHLFDPYFSGREAGRGLGLGLSKCWRIVDLHGGTIEVESGEEGAEFRMRLPVTS